MKKIRIGILIILLLISTVFSVQTGFASSADGQDITNDADEQEEDADDEEEKPREEEETSAEAVYFVPVNAAGSAVDVKDDGVLQLWERSLDRRQTFLVNQQGEYFYFSDTLTGQVIEVTDGEVGKGTRLRLGDYDGSDKQLWSLEKNSDGSYLVRSKLDAGYVMDNYYATKDNGAAIVIDELNGNENQRFFMMTESQYKQELHGLTGYGQEEGYAIVPACAGASALDFHSSSQDVRLYKSHRGKNQTWKLNKKGNYYAIESVNDGKVIQVKEGIPDSGQSLVEAGYDGSDEQLWKLEPAGDGTYYIRSKLSETFVMDVKGASGDNSTPVTLYPFHGGPNQKFRLVHVTTPEPISEWGASRHDCYGSNWDIWDGSTDTSWYYENKNASVYEISTAAQLAGMAQLVRDNIQSFEKRIIHLTRDINLAGIEWNRIGTEDHPFKGGFNGNGHAIVGLSITTTATGDGFFGAVNGGVVCNFAIKGAVSGDWNTGGVIGNLQCGQAINIYSEVALTRATDDNAGGICGRLGGWAYIEHCTQNARINSGDQDPDRGGIAGYSTGLIRYCVNMSSVDCNWNYVGGITGQCVGGKIEYCANYGQISGGGDTERAGGICGMVKDYGVIFGCYNEGYVYSSGDDHIGGICGKREDGGEVYCCINMGNVKGDTYVGGVVGNGRCSYCFNGGRVWGDSHVGAVSGSAGSLDWCRSLSWTTASLNGEGDNNGAEWISANEILSGKACYDLNEREGQLDLGGYSDGISEVFFQNLGGDPIPSFSGQKVNKVNEKYVNDQYQVRVDLQKGYGIVSGAGAYGTGSQVTLKAQPADGCMFDHYEVCNTVSENREMHNGTHPFPTTTVKTYTDPEITLTKSINNSYSVKAVFTVFDDTPEDLKQYVKLELECVDDVDGWNGSTVPVYLVDTAGERHLWEVPKDNLDGDGNKADHTFYLGTSSPVAVEVYPDFGGGLTFHDLGLKARMWINNAGQAIESGKVMIRSYPFISSKWGGDYMSLTFGDSGNSIVGLLKDDGSIDSKGTYTSCSKAWEAAGKLGDNAVIQLTSPWLLDGRLYAGDGTITLDLNGYPVIRSIKKTTKNGEVIEVADNATVNVIDSAPSRVSCSAFSGGSIQGGRSTNGAGLVDVKGTFNMTGGALYNGGTTDVGGGIRVKGGTVYLKNTLISDCWSNQAWYYDNDGGGIAIRNDGKVTLEYCTIRNCTANEKGGGIHINSENADLTMIETLILSCRTNDEEGGAIYTDGGSTVMTGGLVNNCRSKADCGGGIYQNKGTLDVKNVKFLANTCDDDGGAIYINTKDQTWLRGCSFINNTAGDCGGAIYQDQDYLYMENCKVTGNASSGDGGGIYMCGNCSVDLCGVIVVKNNDGEGSRENLVLESGAYFYNQGLEQGSEVHMRSTSDSGEILSINSQPVSEYQLRQFLVSDHPKDLELSFTREEDTRLMASSFGGGRIAIYIGIAAAAAAGIAFGVSMLKRKKGAGS